MTNPIIKTCPQCGNDFTALSARRIFCYTCRPAVKKKRKKRKMPLKQHICQTCGNPFTSRATYVKHCDNCRKILRKQVAKANYQKKKQLPEEENKTS